MPQLELFYVDKLRRTVKQRVPKNNEKFYNQLGRYAQGKWLFNIYLTYSHYDSKRYSSKLEYCVENK